jgi:FAD/FMN-containing dehydrogenase
VAHLDGVVLADPSSVMHNADLMPPRFNRPVSITWRKTNKPLTEEARLVPRGQRYATEQNVLWALTELPGGEHLRRNVIHPLLTKKPVVKWLNHEASLDAAELEPRTRQISTYALQEYFVPKRNFVRFAQEMAKVLVERSVEAVNVSIRHSPKDTVSCMPWAKEEVLSFVLYYKQRTHQRAQNHVALWTRELVDAALSCEGRYYLPYQLHATRSQFEQAYPEIVTLRQIKKKWDPHAGFSNSLWAKYL